ncbi:MAG: helix-turn-helix domain-containing protein [Bacteroidota bacterium]
MVLPFVDRSADQSYEFFCDGITEDIINALASIEDLKVISRTSSFYFKEHKSTTREIGEQLQVANLLEGSVRISEQSIRIQVQLIDIQADRAFWSATWNRSLENLFDTQDEISLLIADQLREQLGHLEISERLVERATEDVSAYEWTLQGHHHFSRWNPEDVTKAIACYERAIERDAKLIDAHLGLADAYGFLATAGFAPREASWKKAQESLATVRAMDPQHAVLNYQLANQVFFTEAKYAQAVAYTRIALETRPAYPEAQQFMAFLYMLRGEMGLAATHLQFAKAIDPLNEETDFYLAYFAYRSHDYETAITTCEHLLQGKPKSVPALVLLSYALLQAGKYEAVRLRLEAIPDELIMPDEQLGLRCLVSAKEKGAVDPDRLASLLAQSENHRSFQADAYLFLVYAVLGKQDAAFVLLEKVHTHHSAILLLAFHDPLSQNLRADPRYANHLQQLYALADPPNQPPKPRTPSSSALEPEKAQALSQQLLAFVEQERPYLNPSLSLRALAQQVGLHPNQLSWLLNSQLGNNFNEFINAYRVDHFKELVVDPGNAHISLLGLAYESGFRSKTVFNTCFKKTVGMTPKAYQKAHRPS